MTTVQASSVVAVLAIGVVILCVVIIPFAVGTIEWIFNIGNTRRQ